ncbi:hypothetical protein D3C87_1469360 [compost metagenome]
MFGIGGRQNCCLAPIDQRGDDRQQDLRAWPCRDMGRGQRAIGFSCDRFQLIKRCRFRQPCKNIARNRRMRIGMRIDTGRKINPWLRRLRKQRACPGQIAAVLDRIANDIFILWVCHSNVPSCIPRADLGALYRLPGLAVQADRPSRHVDRPADIATRHPMEPRGG